MTGTSLFPTGQTSSCSLSSMNFNRVHFFPYMTSSKTAMRFACQKNQSIQYIFNVKRMNILYCFQHVCCITGQYYTSALLFRPFVTISDTLEKIHFTCMSAFLGNQGDTSPKYKQLISLRATRQKHGVFPNSSSQVQCQNQTSNWLLLLKLFFCCPEKGTPCYSPLGYHI